MMQLRTNICIVVPKFNKNRDKALSNFDQYKVHSLVCQPFRSCGEGTSGAW